CDEEMMQKVERLILSTTPGRDPETTLEKILHDANWSFLGRKRFERRGRLLRLEIENTEGKKYDLYDWSKKMLDMQVGKKFYTAWAVDEYSKRKNKNIAQQREYIVKARKRTIRKKTGKNFGRGVDTVYRVTLRNHINLSSIADGKANMIISINTVILSILITVGSAGFSMQSLSIDENLKFIIPILVLMLGSLTAIVFAVLSAIPKVSGARLNKADLLKEEASLLYFGNFLQLEKEEFVKYLRDLKEDQEVLYDDLSRDLYNLGKVLNKKYRLLTIAYRTFVIGLAASVLSMLAVILLI
ncbi:MAG: DUF5706 domain-containing protein, partial [Saprospiraceae bacterium]|nr:DUF5706 domain-containing protein [Saprospiraceae bacterium]